MSQVGLALLDPGCPSCEIRPSWHDVASRPLKLQDSPEINGPSHSYKASPGDCIARRRLSFTLGLGIHSLALHLMVILGDCQGLWGILSTAG